MRQHLVGLTNYFGSRVIVSCATFRKQQEYEHIYKNENAERGDMDPYNDLREDKTLYFSCIRPFIDIFQMIIPEPINAK